MHFVNYFNRTAKILTHSVSLLRLLLSSCPEWTLPRGAGATEEVPFT
jgi:hypothetical protein